MKCRWVIGVVFGLVLINGPWVWAKDDAPRALDLMSRMLGSMSHIRTIQCDVTMIKTTPQKTVTSNYSLVADQKGNAVVKILGVKNKVFVQNQKGFYLVNKGESFKQPESFGFPFDIPSKFLDRLNMKDVSDN